jgi:hypothetical protein
MITSVSLLPSSSNASDDISFQRALSGIGCIVSEYALR